MWLVWRCSFVGGREESESMAIADEAYAIVGMHQEDVSPWWFRNDCFLDGDQITAINKELLSTFKTPQNKARVRMFLEARADGIGKAEGDNDKTV